MNDAPNFSQEKGTDNPAQPGPTESNASEQSRYPTDTDYRHEKASEQVATPKVREYPPPPKPRILNAKFLWLAVAGTVVVAGVFGYRFYQSLPFRIKDDTIILRDSHGGTLEIDTKPELPDSFPSDIPIFPDAELKQVAALGGGGNPEQTGGLYRWEAPAPLEDVGFWYIEQLELNGWEIVLKQQTSVSTGQWTVIKGERGFVMELKGVSSTRTDIALVFGSSFPQ